MSRRHTAHQGDSTRIWALRSGRKSDHVRRCRRRDVGPFDVLILNPTSRARRWSIVT